MINVLQSLDIHKVSDPDGFMEWVQDSWICLQERQAISSTIIIYSQYSLEHMSCATQLTPFINDITEASRLMLC